MTTLAFIVLAAVGGAAFLYFFLRANPRKSAALDAAVTKAVK